MPTPNESKPTLKRRLKIAALSLLGLIVPALACVPCPTTCYAPVPPTDTPTPFVTCYVAVPETPTPTPTPFTSPLPTPTPTPEARHQLLDRLLAEGRLPEAAARALES